MDLNEKIIEFVRPYKCLYDPSKNDYKNVEMKARIWTSIAAQLNESCDTVRRKWKTMRDGYIKYKKQLKSSEWNDRKHSHYVWAGQLSFLDEINDAEDTGPKIYNINTNKSGEKIVFIETGNVPSIPVNNVIIPDVMLPQSGLDIPSTSHHSSQSLAIPKFAPPGQASNDKQIEEQDVDRMILDFLKRKSRKRTHDNVDYLFLSYAQSFKKLSSRKQASLKVDLARVFAQAELSDLGSKEDQWIQTDIVDDTSVHSRRSSSSAASSSSANSDSVIVKEEPDYDDVKIEYY